MIKLWSNNQFGHREIVLSFTSLTVCDVREDSHIDFCATVVNVMFGEEGV